MKSAAPESAFDGQFTLGPLHRAHLERVLELHRHLVAMGRPMSSNPDAVLRNALIRGLLAMEEEAKAILKEDGSRAQSETLPRASRVPSTGSQASGENVGAKCGSKPGTGGGRP
jgi:hypothetical protein